MESRQLLVIGIDPGTTLGYAVLDIKGNLIKTDSSRVDNFNSLIRLIVDMGKPVIVGCDKKNPPAFVEKFATRTGAKLVCPKNDLLKKEKSVLARDYSFKKDHELDALASAVNALKKFSHLMKRIDSYLKQHKLEEYEPALKELMILGEGLSIKHAMDIITKTEENPIKTIKKEMPKKQLDKDYSDLYRKFRNLEKENILLRRYESRLKHEIRRHKALNQKLIRKTKGLVSEDKLKDRLKFKERRMQSFAGKLNSANREIIDLKKNIHSLNLLLLHIDKSRIIKKLDTLGMPEYNLKNKRLNIKKDDVIFVKNPGIFSKKLVNELKKKVSVIVSDKKLNKDLKSSFIPINSAGLKLKEFDDFVIMDKKEFENALNNVSMLNNIVDNYRNSRKKNAA